MIEVTDLVKRYGRHIAVNHLSFKIEKGQVYGFLGPNGAGKTTTMNIIAGYLGPTSGTVLINGIDVVREPEGAKKYIGYLPEQPPIYDDMTVKEYLQFAADLKKVSKKEREERIDVVMEKTSITDVSGRLIRNLSKGYRQRVGLANALIGNPEIIILDEPTVGLDPMQIIEIRGLIRDLSKEHTVILSSHILPEVQEVCDKIMIIHHGEMAAIGSAEELKKTAEGSASLDVSVKSKGKDAATVFQEIAGVKSVTSLPCAEQDVSSFRLERVEDTDIRESVFDACVASQMPILMMNSSGVSLEDIFLKLTSDMSSEQDNSKLTSESSVEVNKPETDEEPVKGAEDGSSL